MITLFEVLPIYVCKMTDSTVVEFHLTLAMIWFNQSIRYNVLSFSYIQSECIYFVYSKCPTFHTNNVCVLIIVRNCDIYIV